MSKKFWIWLIILIFGGMCIYYGVQDCKKKNNKVENNKVTGYYSGRTYNHLSIKLENDYSFFFYNSVSGLKGEGTYSYSLSDNKDEAYVTLNLKNGYCPYTSAIIYIDTATGGAVLYPQIDGSRVNIAMYRS